MSHLDILLPFALPPPELAPDLLKELRCPALAHLLSRAKAETGVPRRESFDDFSRALPHEVWLARSFGLEQASQANTSPAVATALMEAMDLSPAEGTWFILQPVHIHIGRDHLVLTDPRQLALQQDEARQLFDIARSLFEEAGKTLISGNETTWFLRADDWQELQTSTLDAASGHNIDLWMPKGPGERNWRKVQNEVQMHWHDHPVNTERELRGEKQINSLWLWGGASAAHAAAAKTAPYDYAFNLGGWTSAFGARVSHVGQADTAAAALQVEPADALILLDKLLEPALASDWGRWLDTLHALENTWFARLLDALKGARIEEVTLVLTDNVRLARFCATRSSLRKFWVKPSLTPLLS